MTTALASSAHSHAAVTPQSFPAGTRNPPRVQTAQAAYYLTLVPGTLREQHMRGTYDPRLNPIKIGNRIAWSMAGIRAVLEVA